ncbi:hypothetical protein GOP47_0008406 [Adiantum capillus-veneris]|uniref:Peptidase C14 caspase domain-containing protein n=1 Tax=Adiantum capillus-veneris TaxID=13818 RepID=A0A9D4UYR6_ADICA|nr:hypothetical protein GOP47_0008406 [Adiantum capillus-veneris]
MVKRAVLVACNYPGSKAELQGCINDVNRIHKTLIERFGFSKSDINVLVDTDSSYTQPTGANIRSALEKLVANTKPGDVLFFHYSGHGVRVPAETGQSDDTGYDECIVPSDMNLITDDDFRELVDRIPAGATFTLISDSCHSGGLVNNAKEQIGESSKQGGSVAVPAPAPAPASTKAPAKKPAGKRELGGFAEGLKSFVSGKMHGASEDGGAAGMSDSALGNGAHQHLYKEQDEYFQNVPYEGEAHVRSRSLPVSTLLEILKEKTGRDDLDVGAIRPTLFHMFREHSSNKVKAFVKVMMHGMHDDNDDQNKGSGHHDIRGAVGALAHRFLKHKLDEEDNADDYLKPAMEMEVVDRKAAYAGGKAAGKIGGKAGGGKPGGAGKANAGKAGGSNAGGKAESKEEKKSMVSVIKDLGILISGCQSHETSADANPTGKEGDAYGAMSNALQTILSQQKGPITNHELVSKLREALQKQGFSQHPGLYCNDENASRPFIC